jgi:hypothetical protein
MDLCEEKNTQITKMWGRIGQEEEEEFPALEKENRGLASS